MSDQLFAVRERNPGERCLHTLTTNNASPNNGSFGLVRPHPRLLRRQLESHPELYRLSAENRLLREHMARGTKGTWKRNAGYAMHKAIATKVAIATRVEAHR